MFARVSAAAIVAMLAVAAAPAHAQSGGGERSFVTSFDCAKAIRPDQTAICSSPDLAAMDIQTATLLTVVGKLVGPEEATDLRATQRNFLTARAACGDDFNCIGNSYVNRIAELAQLVDEAARLLREKRESGAN